MTFKDIFFSFYFEIKTITFKFQISKIKFQNLCIQYSMNSNKSVMHLPAANSTLPVRFKDEDLKIKISLHMIILN